MGDTLPITVIIPSYNRAPWLYECLRSVEQQTQKAREVIVIDDGSTDDTERMCSQLWPAVRYIYQDHQGVSAARNRGIEEAHTPWLAFLDSDDLWQAEKLAAQWDYLERYPETRVVQTEEIWIRQGRRVNPRQKHQKPSGWIFEELIKMCLVSPSAVMIHNSVFAEVGGFDETLPACEDYDLWLRIALYQPIVTIDLPLTIKRGGHEDQLSRQWGLDRYRVQALEKILQDPAISAEQKILVKENIRQRCDILIQGFQKHGTEADVLTYQQLKRHYAE